MTGRPMRLTQVVTTPHFAGTERYVADVSRELAARGHDVQVVGGDPAAMPQALGGDVRWTAGSDAQTAARALAGGGRRDILHTHMTKADFLGLGVSPISRAAQVSTRHITAPRGYSPKARRLAPLVRRRLACEIAVSEWTSQQLERPADVVLVNGVQDVPDVSEARERIVLVAQRLAPEKDTATAVRAFAASGLANQGWALHLAGRGEERDAIVALVNDSGLADHVEIHGWVDDMAVLYRRAAILLASAPSEPCGLTVIEAMAHGLPVVAAGAAGHLETVGRAPAPALFAAGDAGGAAEHLVRLAEDDAARTAYGEQLRTLQRSELTLIGHVDRLEQIYDQVLAGRRPAST